MTNSPLRRFPALLLAWRNLTRNPVRSALAGAGIAIGVIAIASLGMFGVTLHTAAMDQLGDVGSTVAVRPPVAEGTSSFGYEEVQRIERVTSGVGDYPVATGRVTLRGDGGGRALSAIWMDRPGDLYNASSGSIPDEFDRGVLVGSAVANQTGLEVGDTVTFRGRERRVRAVLKEQPPLTPANPNTKIVVPISAHQSDPEEIRYSLVVIRGETGLEADEQAEKVKRSFARDGKQVRIRGVGDVADRIARFFRILDIFLVGMGTISLLVAGVGIFNTMLMSVVERRGEIGLLRAVGVQRARVSRIILSEAALLGLVSSAVGTVLSVGAGVALNYVALGEPLATFQPANLGYLALAFCFGVGTSIVTGIYPAWKAAGDRPAEALRS